MTISKQEASVKVRSVIQGPELATVGRGTAMRQLRLAAELEGFYRQLFLPLVRRATWKHGLSKEDARDVVQDAFVIAVVKLKAGKNGRSWLISTVDHLATNLRRKSARHARLEAQFLDPLSPPEVAELGSEIESWRPTE